MGDYFIDYYIQNSSGIFSILHSNYFYQKVFFQCIHEQIHILSRNGQYTNHYSCEHGSIRANSNWVKIRHSCEHEFGISVSNFPST